MDQIKMYLVGGYNRDRILGVESKDIDYAIECDSYETMKAYIVNELKYTIVYEKPEFLTIKAKLTHSIVDFVLCRKEGIYHDNRHPSLTEPGTIYDDLSRRDFTMNSIAINTKTNEIIDPYNGQQHIREKRIECVGEAKERFSEDALRLLRAVRFHITLGFSMSDTICECLHDESLIKKLESISLERIAQEISKCMENNMLSTMNCFIVYPKLFAFINKYLQFKLVKKLI